MVPGARSSGQRTPGPLSCFLLLFCFELCCPLGFCYHGDSPFEGEESEAFATVGIHSLAGEAMTSPDLTLDFQAVKHRGCHPLYNPVTLAVAVSKLVWCSDWRKC